MSQNDPGRAELKVLSRPSALYFSALRLLLHDQRESAATSVRFVAVKQIESAPVLVGSSQHGIVQDFVSERPRLALAHSLTPAVTSAVEVCANAGQAVTLGSAQSVRIRSMPTGCSQLVSDISTGCPSE